MSTAMAQLHRSLDTRLRPEQVAALVIKVLTGRLPLEQHRQLGRVAVTGYRWQGWSSMSDDFARPIGGGRQVAAAVRLFDVAEPQVDVDDPASLIAFAETVGPAIGAVPDRLDFLRDRLNREARAQAGLDLSKRQYNRRFRVLQRVTAKAGRLDAERVKRELVLTARAGFAADLTLERFAADPDAAAFVAYYTAKRKLRREFTLSGRDNPYDEIADLLYRRCLASRTTDWAMIATAYATPDVLRRLTDAQRGELLGRWAAMMRTVADRLAAVWASGRFDRATMIVQGGNDSSTWNLLCGAYNAARAAWLSCLDAAGATALLDAACPGKAMMLVAGDLAAWHWSTGGGLHPDVTVWSRLPLPWEVLAGTASCTRADVEAACAEAGVDPEAGGWVGPRRAGRIGTFTPTPELVHGVSVADPIWATVLRGAGVFSGKRITDETVVVPADVVVSDLPAWPVSGGHDPGGSGSIGTGPS